VRAVAVAADGRIASAGLDGSATSAITAA
jgi:hypothetical protein